MADLDLDDGNIDEKRDHAIRHLGNPTLEIASGGTTETGQQKRHLYWRLTEAATGDDLARAAALRGLLARKLGGDTSFKSLHQPIRVAGTIHGKNGIQTPVTILNRADREYELSDLEDAARRMSTVEGQTLCIDTGARPAGGPSARDLAVTPIHAGAADDLTRFAALSRVIGHWIRTARNQKCTLDDAWDAVCDHNAAMICPPWPEARLRREFGALVNRDVRNHGPMPPTVDKRHDEVHSGLAPNSEE